MTVLIIGVTGSIKRIQVKATDEAYPFGDELTTMNITYVGLSDGITAFGPIQQRVQGIDEVDIAVVTHSEILNSQRVAPEVEHGEITNGSLGLSTLGGKDDIVRIFAHSNEVKTRTTYNQAKGLSTIFTHFDCGVVRIVNPIDARPDVYGGAVDEMGAGLLEGAKRERSVGTSLCIDHEVEAIKALGMRE